ncbi:MAG: thioredoxin-dependent thiol peroxidase [Acidobacteriota bacterium]|jgi:peroxiredoxin Q/BCP
MQVGDIVEDFTLPDQDGNSIRLSDFAGKTVVLFFYPRANTPGCTVEACGFQSELARFQRLQGAGVVVLGISRDTVKAQKKFAEKFGLQYPLLADADESICNRFGVIKEKNMYGKKVTGIERTTYVIGPDRRLKHVFAKVKPEGHAEEVLALLKK